MAKRGAQKGNDNGSTMTSGLTGNLPIGMLHPPPHGLLLVIQLGHLYPPKGRVNSPLARLCGATSIRLTVIPQIGVLKILTNLVDHRNSCGATIIRPTGIPLKNVERVKDFHHHTNIRAGKVKPKDLTARGKATISLLIMTRQHLSYRLTQTKSTCNGGTLRKS